MTKKKKEKPGILKTVLLLTAVGVGLHVFKEVTDKWVYKR